MKRLLALLAHQSVSFAAAPRDALPLDAPEWPLNYRLHLEDEAKVKLCDELTLSLDAKGSHDIAVEHPAKGAPVLRVWSDGKLVRGPEDVPALAKTGAQDFPDVGLDLGADFTAMAEFESTGQGTLFSMCAPTGKWPPDAKALFIRGGRLVYDIGWLGAINSGPKVNDGKPRTAVLSVSGGTAKLWLDGKEVAEKANFTKPDQQGHVFKVGRAAPNFGGDFTDGKISVVKVWKRALPRKEIALLFKDSGAGANTPDFTHTPKGSGKPVIEGGSGWVQALERSDHAEIVGGWNAKTLEEGATIYKTLCIVCHGTTEQPGWIDYGSTPIFTRTLNVAATDLPVQLNVASETVNVVLKGDGSLRKAEGFGLASLPGNAKTRLCISRVDPASLDTMANNFNASLDLEPLTKGDPSQWPQTVATTSLAGKEDAAFIADDFPLPVENPFHSWMRPGGFDFTPDGKAAIVAMWNGDVWRVDGLMAKAPATLTWRRIASGLFQPLGVKFRDGELFVLCRDQLAKLVDLNADGETDFIECFDDDAQVTEHFHEFAMGLQTDAAGNFYYAKSGRHALDSVIPQHGTLLKVSADGSKTDILATGFRAANGVCLNVDGTFFVTDQEGFWTPKNRINRVKVGGLYGNMFGYTSVTDTSDSAMEQPLVWVKNDKSRSPAELIWVPKNAWGNLGGSLLNLSYGTGKAFIIPHEEVNGQWQGAVCELPMPAFATGIMRGRFGSDGALYTCGMFARGRQCHLPRRLPPHPSWPAAFAGAASGACHERRDKRHVQRSHHRHEDQHQGVVFEAHEKLWLETPRRARTDHPRCEAERGQEDDHPRHPRFGSNMVLRTENRRPRSARNHSPTR